jgi:hypothetical protein
MAKWWKDRDDWMPGSPLERPRHDRDSEDDSQIPTEDIGDVDDESSDEPDDVELPDRGVDQ